MPACMIVHTCMCSLLQGLEMNQFTFGDGRTGGTEHTDLSTNHKVTKVKTTCTCMLSSLPVSFVYSIHMYVY